MTNNRVVLACLFSWLAFWPAVWLAPRLYLFDFVNALGFTFGAAVLWRYGPGAVLALRKVLVKRCSLSRGHMLILGIEATWLAMVARSLILWVWRWYGEPDGGLDGANMAFVAWLIITGGAFHLAASAMPEDEVELPRVSSRLFRITLLAGLLLGGLIAAGRYAVSP